MTQEFLATLTDFTRDDGVELRFFGPRVGCDAVVHRERVAEARQIFGPEVDPSEPRWKIQQPDIDAAIKFALDDDRFPKQEVGPTFLHIHYRFLWKEMERLPYQPFRDDARSRICRLEIYFGQRQLFLQPSFIFPAPWHSTYLRDFITRLEPIIPFRFRDQYFKRALPGRNGKRGRVLKLTKAWRAT